MMQRTQIQDITGGAVYKIQGFVENIRNKRSMAFLVIRDVTGKLQLTIDKQAHPDVAAVVDQLTLESVVTAHGEVVENDYVKMGGKEMLPTMLTIESIADALPIQKDASLDLRLDYRWLELRSEQNAFIFKMQTYMTQVLRDFFLERDYLEIHSPKLIGTASESGADVFELEYFDRKAYLSQSPQFYKQMAMAGGFERIFEVGPVFRAEKSHTSRHATEFTGFDVEVSYIDSYRDLMQLEEELLTQMLQKIQARYGEDIERLYGQKVVVPTTPFPVIRLRDLYTELEKRYGYTVPESEKGDLTTDAEKLSQRFAQEEYGHEFLFVTDFDAEKRAFYHMRKDGIPQGYDLIWRGVEITTGAQREHRYAVLKQQAEEKGLGEDVKFYLEFFQYGCPPHGGFGMGIDRLTMLLLGLGIKETMFIFRGPNRLNP